MSNENWPTSSEACARSASDHLILLRHGKHLCPEHTRGCYRFRQTLFKRGMLGGRMSVHSTGLEAFKTVVRYLGRVRQTLFQPFILDRTE